MQRSTFIKRVRDTIRQYDMLEKSDKVLVAVSGGADSVSLLKALIWLGRELGLKIVVANMDHGLRGEESERDSEFVKELSLRLGLPFVHKKVKVGKSRRKGMSTEETAREKRYSFLLKAARDNGCGVIATGHTMDDQAETVMIRIIAGSSLAGLTGIPPVRYERGVKIVRPLIRVSREEALLFLEKSGEGYVTDSSNLDKRFLRNSVRLEVLPFLERYNPKIMRSLVNLSDTLREDLELVSKKRKEALKGGVRGRVASVKLMDMMMQPKAIRKGIFKELFQRAGGNVKKLTYRHWTDMDYFLRAAEKGKSLDFPGDIRVKKIGDEIVFGKRVTEVKDKG